MVRARHSAVVVLPSPGSAEVMATTFTACPVREDRMEVRRLRNDSAKRESGLATT